MFCQCFGNRIDSRLLQSQMTVFLEYRMIAFFALMWSLCNILLQKSLLPTMPQDNVDEVLSAIPQERMWRKNQFQWDWIYDCKRENVLQFTYLLNIGLWKSDLSAHIWLIQLLLFSEFCPLWVPGNTWFVYVRGKITHGHMVSVCEGEFQFIYMWTNILQIQLDHIKFSQPPVCTGQTAGPFHWHGPMLHQGHTYTTECTLSSRTGILKKREGAVGGGREEEEGMKGRKGVHEWPCWWWTWTIAHVCLKNAFILIDYHSVEIFWTEMIFF